LRWFIPYAEYGKGEFHITDHAILLAKTNHTIKNSEKYRTKCLKNFITITEHKVRIIIPNTPLKYKPLLNPLLKGRTLRT
jgi:hypothetical protein